jgi:tetratricopeptide (TPR) repeat protein
VEPNHPLLNQGTLQRLNQNLVLTWGLGKEAIPVLEFMIERYPPGPQGLLAEAHVLAGDYQAAIEVYTRLVEQFPNNSNIRSRLESLRSTLSRQ